MIKKWKTVTERKKERRKESEKDRKKERKKERKKYLQINSITFPLFQQQPFSEIIEKQGTERQDRKREWEKVKK